MSDTSAWAAAQMDALYRGLTGEERIRMASSMFDTARKLAIAGIRAQEPDIDAAELRVRLFRRFYSDDFEPARLERLAEQIGASTPRR